MSLIPPNAMIVPVDTRFSRKAVILPDAATNPGRYLVCKDVYGTANVSSIYFSTLTGNYFEQSYCNTYVGSQSHGAWHLTNDGNSRWFFTNLYTDDFFVYAQTNIVQRGLFFSLEGNSFTGGSFWADSLNNINLSSGIGAAAPGVGFDQELRNVPALASNDFFRSFTPFSSANANNTSSYTYSLWLSTALVGCVLNEALNPTTLVSTVSQANCSIVATNAVRTGYRSRAGGTVQTDSRFTPGQWINVAWSVNISTFTTYINGSTTGFQNNNINLFKSSMTNSYLTVGMGNPSFSLGTSVPYRGLIGSIRLYSTVLSLAEVRQNYNADAFRYGLKQVL